MFLEKILSRAVKRTFKSYKKCLEQIKLKKHELKTLFRVGKIEEGKIRPIIVKLNDKNAKQRLLKLRNLKYTQLETQSNVYINPDRTVEEIKSFKS